MQNDGNHVDHLDLMEGETIENFITSKAQNRRSSARGGDALLLTNRRIIHISGTGIGSDVVMAAIEDVDAVEFIEVTEGYAAFLWAALAVMLSMALYGILENQIARTIVPLMVLAMGVYLVINRIFFSGGPAAMFRTGGSAITWLFRSESEREEVRDFINELYRLKSSRGADSQGSFAPR